MEIRKWFGFQGRVNRSSYALAGIFGVLLKYNLDRWLALRLIRTPWTLWSYLFPVRVPLDSISPYTHQSRFLVLLGLTAIPFIWFGMAMTVKRLRDAGLNRLSALLFFAPAANIPFFIFLCIVPGREKTLGPPKLFLRAVLPRSKWGIAIFSVLAASAVGAGLGALTILVMGTYGWTLFLAIPFFMGFLSAWLFAYEQARSLGECIGVAMLSVVLASLMLIGIAVDGLFCILMAAPIGIVLAGFGAFLAYSLQTVYRIQTGSMLSLVLALPLFCSAEYLSPLPTPAFTTHTAIEISAPPRSVWKHLVSFSRIDQPLHPIFRFGISYPLEAQITGSGLTADRKCIFSSGSFREPILAWDEGKHFAFGVSEEPLLMREWSPYSSLHVRHLEDHDFRPQRADFFLTELPGGRTRLDGWTTYENRMWPGAYWRIFTDAILHQIHFRVFRHVKELSEADARSGSSHGPMP